MAFSLVKVIRSLQSSKRIGGNFGVEVAIVSRALLDKNNNVAADPDTLGQQCILTDVDTGTRYGLYIKDGELKYVPVGNPLI